ncbi:hypothetical protein [Teredinibacter haidensis]|uniref:hypothetical protein n=1 Tax=Teredinibacter haidensis TaxID=2731755 RepID=UPI000A8D3783|nr:hypothetical protein [Teredinibacter haidensis]
MMDDEALIHSAQMRRDTSMTNQVRLLNSQWLLQDQHNTWSGNKAVSKFLKIGLKRFISVRYKMQNNLVEQPENNDFETSIWNTYSLEVSGNKVMLGMKFQF